MSERPQRFAQGESSARGFLLVGNRLCVDFANTLYPAQGGGSLRSWRDLIEFLTAVGIVGAARRGDLLELETVAPQATLLALRAALELRDALRKILEAITARERISPERVEPVNALLRWTEGYEQLLSSEADAGAWRLDYVVREQRLEWLLAAIARSAAELIVEGPAAPLRKCAHPACVLCFYDTSRTRRRRWCSMAVCGNRSKVAAHARRQARVKRKGHRRPK